jgi:alcohol dehydrogenase class IV
VHYGWRALENLPRLVRDTGATRVLLVCGARSLPASGADRVLPRLGGTTDVLRWSDFRPNPNAADLAMGLAVLRRVRPDLVLGIGGGSAMDMAKLLCAFAGTGEAELDRAIRAGRSVDTRREGLVLVPTTCGSGSEATSFAVVYLGSVKYSVAGAALRADEVVLDPALTVSSSRHQRAASGLDAVAHAIESLWAVAATARSRRYARMALRLLLPAIEPFVQAPGEPTARAMTIGSHLAGRAIDISRTTAAHALSYGLTTRHGISHGHAVALVLGPIIQAHAEATPGMLRPGVCSDRHARALATILTALGASSPSDARDRFVALATRLGLPMRLTEAGVDHDDLRALAEDVNLERLGNNPIPFTTDGLTDLLELSRWGLLHG